jgi:hypothetical protein
MSRFLCRALPVLVVASLVAGCNAAGLPKTYPVTGSVVYKGGQPLKGGMVQFTPVGDSPLRVVGPIQEDGRFTLATQKDNAKADGAPEGDYRVTVILPLQADPRGGLSDPHRGVPPIVLPKTYKVEAKDDNELKIELPQPPPRP